MAITTAKANRTGSLKQRVVFQREEQVSDGMGNTFPDWVDDFEAWANIQPISGNQRLQLDAVNQSVTHQVTIRHRPDESLQGRRMKYNGREFNIHYHLNEGEERAYDELGASENLQPN